MTSVDDLFKRPGSITATNGKRKFDAIRNPDEIYKSARTSLNGDAKGKQHARIDDDDGEQEDQDVSAGPELPPDDDEGVEDEEGRFFGSGVSRDTADVLDYMDERDAAEAEPEKIDTAWLRRTALAFERRISKNAELRAKHEDEPQKFMASEADLDADIKALSILTDYPELYAEFVRLGCANSLVQLLAHENTDIAINAIEILSELTDEDVQATQAQWDTLVEALLDADLADLLVQNFERLNEDDESDRSGVYHSLSLVENLASQSTVLEKVSEQGALLTWLIARLQKKENPTSQNKQYAAEVLAISLQASEKIRLKVIELDGVDICLNLLSAYRKRDPPKDSEEEEYAENLFDCLTCLVETQIGKEKFVEGEGIELHLIMLKEGKFSKHRALRVLDHALGGYQAGSMCEKFVEAAGLKPIFAAFMKASDQAGTEHVLGIFASLLRQLPGDSAPRIRTLAKFIEKSYEKVERLVKLRRDYAERLGRVDAQIKQERSGTRQEDMEELESEWLSRRLDAGLFCFQTIDVVLAWLVAEDDGIRNGVVTRLKERDESLDDVKKTLQEQLDGLQDEKTDDAANAADMLRTLIEIV